MLVIIIVGSGVAGLTAANALSAAGYEDYLIVERSGRIGGRVATETDGEFLFDVGFAVLNPAYPMVQRYLSIEALGLGYFQSGAILLQGSPKRTLMVDPIAHPLLALQTLAKPFPGWRDRMKTLRLRLADSGLKKPRDEGTSTLEALRKYGFSEPYIEAFFRPFFSGVFLDDELSISEELFRYQFDFFKKSRVGLPRAGIHGVVELLAHPIPKEKFMLGCNVSSVHSRKVTLEGGRTLDAAAVIVAVDESSAAEFFGNKCATETRSVVTFYFASEECPWPNKLLGLNSTGRGWVNHIAPLSLVQPSYAKGKRQLISVSGVGRAPTTSSDLSAWKTEVQADLVRLVGPEANTWTYLRHYVVDKALPKKFGRKPSGPDEVFFAGDYVENPSLQGAMQSGEFAAAQALKRVLPLKGALL